MFKHVLIPTDGSRASAKAVKAGVALAKEMGARVTGFHGVGAVPYDYYGEPVFLDQRLVAKAERAVLAAGEQHVAQIAKAARAAVTASGGDDAAHGLMTRRLAAMERLMEHIMEQAMGHGAGGPAR